MADDLLTRDQMRAIALEVGLLPSHDGVVVRSAGQAGGMTAEDGFAFGLACARAALDARQGASEADAEQAAFYRYARDDPERFGICEWDDDSESWCVLDPARADSILRAARSQREEGKGGSHD